ncbi:MAG: transketolase C-terminal domain-containing protein, partial [Ignavibacteria bacterium]
AAGLATEGYTPVVAVYSTFLQRAYDQIIHDVSIQHLPVIFVLDRAGLVGADGPTHHGALDLSYFRCIQGSVIMSPKDEQELRNMIYTATLYKKGPITIRYPRGNGLGVEIKPFEKIEIGKGEILEKGKDVAVLAVGHLVNMSVKAREELAKENIDVEVVNMRFIKPLDGDLLYDVFSRHNKILTIEDNVIIGGFGSAILEFINQNKIKGIDVIVHGLPDKFIDHATPEQLYEELKMDGKGIASIIREFLISKVNVL